MQLERTATVLAAALLSVLTLPAQDQVDMTVTANMDIYRAGGQNDGSDGIMPGVFTFPAGGWRTLSFPSAGGGWSCQAGYPEYGADGETSGYCLTAGGPTNFPSIGHLSGYATADFVGALVGVFLADSLPATAPPDLRFYASNKTAGGIQTDFVTLSPAVGQVFFIGDGLTGTGSGLIQTFVVPPTATHLYLGTLATPTIACRRRIPRQDVFLTMWVQSM